jgi:hypothetical protein
MAFLNLLAAPSTGVDIRGLDSLDGYVYRDPRVKAEPAARAGTKYRPRGASVSTLLSGSTL